LLWMAAVLTKTLNSVKEAVFLKSEVTDEAKKALDSKGTFWQGVEWFIDWLTVRVDQFFTVKLAQMPIVGKWATRIGATISGTFSMVLKTFMNFMKTVFGSGDVWTKAHEMSMKAWKANESKGIVAQIYAYGKKMAAYFLQVIIQCLERSIKVNGLELDEEEKKEVTNLLEDILDKAPAN